MKRIALFLLFLGPAVVLPAQTPQTSTAVVACYSFSGNANDGSGNNHNGTVHGATLVPDRFGRADSAYRFDGADQYIEIPADPIIINRDFTFAAWAYIEEIPITYVSSTVFSIGFAEDNYHYGISLGNTYGPIPLNGWVMGGYNTLGSSLAQTRVLPDERRWYHLVLSQTDDSLLMYIDGARAKSISVKDRVPYFYDRKGSIVKIGLRSNGLEPFKGVIDDIFIFNRALFPQEVRTLYAEGLPCSFIPTPQIADVDLCGPGEVTLNASGGDTFRWYDQLNNGTLLLEGNPFTTPWINDSAVFFVANVVKNIESARVKVTVRVHPVPSIECHFPSPVNIKTLQNFTAVGSGGTRPYNYTFDFGDTTQLVSDNGHQTHRYGVENTYEAVATLTDAVGCQSSCYSDVEVEGEIYIPNVVTANYDTLNQAIAVYYRDKSGFTRYHGDNSFEFKVYNRWGEEVYSTHDPQSSWRAESEPPGTYYYRIVLGYEEYKGWVDVLK